MWCKIYVLGICALYFAHVQSVKLEPHRSVFNMAEGSTLEVNCTSPNSIDWTAELPSAMPADAVVTGQATDGDNNMSTLKLVNIQKVNEGVFFCTAGDEQASFQLKVFSVTMQNATFAYKVDTKLECSIVNPAGPVKYSWKKGNVSITDLPREGKQDFRDNNKNGTLEIIHPARSFAGMYTCVAEIEDGSETRIVEVDVPYYATPKVLPFEKSKNLVQGEELEIVCQVLGYPKPYVTWMKGNTAIGGSDSRAKLEMDDAYDGQPIDKALLRIKEVDFDDAGEYSCIARHRQWATFNSTQPILVRVKDKLAALWPFLGIVAEVAILCTIIFIYEKKRNKDAVQEEEEEEQQGDTSAKQADNVRHRGNTNNPRA